MPNQVDSAISAYRHLLMHHGPLIHFLLISLYVLECIFIYCRVGRVKKFYAFVVVSVVTRAADCQFLDLCDQTRMITAIVQAQTHM